MKSLIRSLALATVVGCLLMAQSAFAGECCKKAAADTKADKVCEGCLTKHNMTDFLNNRFDHLDFKARSVTELKRFLARHNAPGDFALPAGMSKLPGYGCRVLAWDGRTVSLICFHLADNQEIHLFVIQSTKFGDAPPAGSVQFASSSGWTTASWRQGGTTYLLAGKGGQASLQKYL